MSGTPIWTRIEQKSILGPPFRKSLKVRPNFAGLLGQQYHQPCNAGLPHISYMLFPNGVQARDTIYIYTPPPGLGLEKIRKRLVYTISWCICKLPKYNSLCIHHHGGTACPRGGVYRKCCILGQLVYTLRNGIHQRFSYFFKAHTRWWCIYIWCPHHIMATDSIKQHLNLFVPARGP